VIEQPTEMLNAKISIKGLEELLQSLCLKSSSPIKLNKMIVVPYLKAYGLAGHLHTDKSQTTDNPNGCKKWIRHSGRVWLSFLNS